MIIKKYFLNFVESCVKCDIQLEAAAELLALIMVKTFRSLRKIIYLFYKTIHKCVIGKCYHIIAVHVNIWNSKTVTGWDSMIVAEGSAEVLRG